MRWVSIALNENDWLNLQFNDVSEWRRNRNSNHRLQYGSITKDQHVPILIIVIPTSCARRAQILLNWLITVKLICSFCRKRSRVQNDAHPHYYHTRTIRIPTSKPFCALPEPGAQIQQNKPMCIKIKTFQFIGQGVIKYNYKQNWHKYCANNNTRRADIAISHESAHATHETAMMLIMLFKTF